MHQRLQGVCARAAGSETENLSSACKLLEDALGGLTEGQLGACGWTQKNPGLVP